MELQPKEETGSIFFEIDIANERHGRLVEAFVPVDLIYDEDVPVDDGHVKELSASIVKESSIENSTGQLTPVLLAEVQDFDKFVIIDGFHRAAAMKFLERDTVYSTIKRDCTWDDVIDLRIITAKSHKSVKFSRIVEWVEESWSRTEWSDRMNASSAFQLAFLKTSSGRRSGLNPEEAEGVRDWVRSKSEQWGVSAPHIDRYLRTARLAAPELVKEARERRGGHRLDAITPLHLEAIVKFIPNNHEHQKLIAEAAKSHVLNIPQTKALSLAVSKAEDEAEIAQLIELRAWERLEMATRVLTKTRYKEIDPTKPAEFLNGLTDKFFDEQVNIAQVLIENAILTGVYQPHITSGNGRVTALMLEHKEEAPEPGSDSPEAEVLQPWDTELVEEVAVQMYELMPSVINHIARKYRLRKEEAEDVVSVTYERFLTRVNDGRVDAKFAHPNILRKLLFQFANYAAIDNFRTEHGRQGQKPMSVSLDSEDENGFSIADTLGEEETGYEQINNNNLDTVKNMLPYLNERERRVLVLKGYFGLSHYDIGLVIGTTEGTVSTSYNTLKSKLYKLLDELSE